MFEYEGGGIIRLTELGGRVMEVVIAFDDETVTIEVHKVVEDGEDVLLTTSTTRWDACDNFGVEDDAEGATERTWPCEVRFYADEECYGIETYHVLAQNMAEARRSALVASDASQYADDRLDYRREVDVGEPEDVDDADDADDETV